ncbi:peptidylprolyl isomerase [Tenacibaculum finnmarkense]|uniref:peptidylprolyl isomerase n=1 Tax=Tenacibaculum finnmarkense TaxID=2781243 RepID=UPI00187B7C68|nr:peptidylprolyl isomerase [Tenacibaculum finnmarkense]MBE7688587.1 peptidylprolyl isomerase [Tenacibaculum finnmarkense genomovar ulcerans]MCG8763183.1 peptidylprolyl isomerase [Tenacibaculum finnmarkense]MCG8788639.1 peptidylprolyl isomerase [Tenacibaculum finnmarkense]
MKIYKILIAVVVLFSACKSVKYPDLENGLYADIQTNRGDILIKLHAKEVPMTVANFVSLAEGDNPKIADSLKGKPYYNTTKFHRVIKDFMVQGGDITGTGRGNAGYKFADEFPMDEKGKLLYKHDAPGVLSMANSGKASNSSQFFITHKATPWLDGKHSIFGKVIIGQHIVDTIQQNDVINHLEIIRIGKIAKKFKAATVFEYELTNVVKKAAERKKAVAELKRKFQEEKGISKAVKTNSGLKIATIKKGTGKKVNPAISTTVHYTLFLTDGTKIDSSVDKNKPFTFTLNDANMPLIAGWKEGVQTMKEGDKSVFFIPYYLGYGENSLGPIPAKSDLIFEIEVLKVGK